jgi:hypothetical protein
MMTSTSGHLALCCLNPERCSGQMNLYLEAQREYIPGQCCYCMSLGLGTERYRTIANFADPAYLEVWAKYVGHMLPFLLHSGILPEETRMTISLALEYS